MKKLLFPVLVLLLGSAYAQMETFGSALTPELSLFGKKCEGGERSEASERICQKGQWMIQLDERRPSPLFLAKLNQVTEDEYEIIPQDFITSERRRLVGRYIVKIDEEETIRIVRRQTK